MNARTKTDIPVAEIAETQTANLTVIQGSREVSVFEKAALELLRRPDASLDQLQQIMQMHERWEERQAEKAFVEAITKFKQNPPQIVKDKFVGYENKDGTKTGYSHASLGAVCDAVIAGLAEVGISHDWKPKQSDGIVGVTCHLTHSAGHKDDGTYIEAPADTSGKKNAIQAVGSTITFLERYTLLAAVGLAAKDQDDDGQQHADPRTNWDWVDEYLDAIRQSKDLASLMASWKTAAGAARRKGNRKAYDELQQEVTERATSLNITPEQWAAAAGKAS